MGDSRERVVAFLMRVQQTEEEKCATESLGRHRAEHPDRHEYGLLCELRLSHGLGFGNPISERL